MTQRRKVAPFCGTFSIVHVRSPCSLRSFAHATRNLLRSRISEGFAKVSAFPWANETAAILLPSSVAAVNRPSRVRRTYYCPSGVRLRIGWCSCNDSCSSFSFLGGPVVLTGPRSRPHARPHVGPQRHSFGCSAFLHLFFCAARKLTTPILTGPCRRIGQAISGNSLLVYCVDVRGVASFRQEYRS